MSAVRAVVLASCLLLPRAAFAAEDLPLAAPKRAKPGQGAVYTEVRVDGPKRGLVLGVKLGASIGVQNVFSTSVLAAVELGYRLPVLHRLLSISLEPALSNPRASRATELGTLAGESLALSVPLLLGANVAAGPGLVRLCAGPSVEWSRSRTSVAGFTFEDEASALGFVGFASYLFHLGPGGLGAELRYRVSAPRMAGSSFTAHFFGVSAAYVLDL